MIGKRKVFFPHGELSTRDEEVWHVVTIRVKQNTVIFVSNMV